MGRGGEQAQLIGTGVIAKWYNVQTKTVDAWRARDPNFPKPDYWVETAGAAIPAWHIDRRPDFDAWYKNRASSMWSTSKRVAK